MDIRQPTSEIDEFNSSHLGKRLVLFEGEHVELNFLVKKFEISLEQLTHRLYTLKWPVEEAVKKRKPQQKRRINYYGQSLTVSETSEHFGLDKKIIYSRLWHNWNDKDIVETPLLRHKILTETERNQHQQLVRQFKERIDNEQSKPRFLEHGSGSAEADRQLGR